MKPFSKRASLVEQIDFLAHFAGVMKKTESLVNKLFDFSPNLPFYIFKPCKTTKWRYNLNEFDHDTIVIIFPSVVLF